ncbi:Arginase family protein [Lihuaxuella thermophila]|uniref:Arginase family protein n=2 Tax=Lihuaxuella thermophila TaxID=1173111 RepID=A0A1H8H499_9BACL|nr:Arginase family protein [Lihuaxuella thermophila]
MGLLHHDVTLLNFDDAYLWQRKLSGFAGEWIDLSDVTEANLFCADRALTEIGNRLSGRTRRGITFIGNGNYHYVTYLLLSEINRPFSLILFDNHTDAKLPGGVPGLLSCGSWVSEAVLRLPHLRQAVIVGVSREQNLGPLDTQSKIVLWPNAGDAEKLLAGIPTEDIYISIDKDVLDRAHAVTNWDHGNMHLRELLKTLQTLIREKNVLGIDICGELPLTPADIWRYADQVRLNEQANLAILHSVLCA